MTAYAPPARCPGCGAAIGGTLALAPDVPYYLCGSTPRRVRCVTRQAPDPNVVWLTAAERRELRALIRHLVGIDA